MDGVRSLIDPNDVTAFIVAVNDSVKLNQNDTLVVEYTAQVNGGELWDDITLNNASWTNAVNSFSCIYYQNRAGSPDTPVQIDSVVGSNEVSTTIMPSAVNVGGHIWIDKDGHGTWDDGESIKEFTGNTLIQQMLANVQINLLTYAGNSNSPAEQRYQQSGDSMWTIEANYKFTGLNPAMLEENTAENAAYDENGIIPSYLKGSEPNTYRIEIRFPKEVSGKYALTSVGVNSGKSRDPRTIASVHPDETTDSNFREAQGAATSERFYLWATDPAIYDNTKDIGLVPLRDLKITKAAEDGTKIEGASFTVYGPFAKDEITAADLIEDNKEGNGTTNANGEVVFENLLWYQNYVIVEDGTAAGYRLDGASASGGNGTNMEALSIDGKTAWLLKIPSDQKTDPVDNVTVTNERIPVKATLEAQKEYTRLDQPQQMTANQFTFALWENPADIGVEGKAPLQTKGNKVDGSVTFGELSFDSPGEYFYYITEQKEGNNPDKGITYDTGTVYRAKVNVDWAAGTGLTCAVSYEKWDTDSKSWTSVTEAKFTNVYDAIGHWTPEGTKVLNGRDMKEGESFTFSVEENGVKVSTGRASGGKDGKEVEIAFKEIEYTLEDEGEHTYVIEEDRGGTTGQGLTWDDASFEVTVNVKDMGDGTLRVTSVGTPPKVKFENTYQPEPIGYAPEVKKVLEGDDLPENAKEFTFILNADPSNPANGAVLPAETYLKLSVAGKQLPQEKTEKFGEITFKKAGIYTFTIEEKKEAEKGYSYDEFPWTLTVEVEDDTNGSLSLKSVEYTRNTADGETGQLAKFTNRYTTTPTTYIPKVTKEITGNRISQNTEFNFTLTPDDGNPPGADLEDSDIRKASVTGAGEAFFEKITFEKAGTYTFTITEDDEGKPGYTYDSSIWTLEVTVEDVDSELTVTEVSYTKNDLDQTTSKEAAAFTNEYQVTPAEYTPQVRKTVTGELPDGKRDAFRFQMTARTDNPEGAVLTGNTTAQVNGSGTTAFGTIRFEQPGTYRFEIREIDDKVNGYQYDGSVWTLTIVVKDTNAVLSVESAVYTKQDGTSASDMAVFQNHYTPEAEPHEDDDDSSSPGTASYTPQVAKQVTGILPSADTMFRFILQAAADNPEGAALESQEAVRAGAGTAAFGKITFSRPGTYRFNIWEEDRGEAGYTYDKNIWLLTVTVENVDGSLKVTSAVYSVPGTEITNTAAAQFVNQYSVAQVISSGVQTGDNAKILQTLAALLISGLVIVILLLAYRKRRKDEKK